MKKLLQILLLVISSFRVYSSSDDRNYFLGKEECEKKLETTFSKMPPYMITQAMLNGQRFVLLAQYSSEQIEKALQEFCQKRDIIYEEGLQK